jgi:glycosyltransferase involved in cell wall biosynthesis
MSDAALPFVSIVVPLYNEERWIDECVRALSAQDYPEDLYEILVIDNNSTDSSAARVAAYPRVRLLREPEQGDFAARNRGIVESRGEILAFTDADTAPHPDWLRTIAANMKDGVNLLVGRLQFGGQSRLLELLEAYEAEKGKFVFSAGIPSIYFGYTCNMAVSRTLFDRAGLFPPVFRNADVVLVRRTVDELSPSALAFCDAMRVRRLEVPSVRHYYRKQMTYGRDFPRYQKLAGARTLDVKQRFKVFGRTVRRNQLGLLDTVRLLAVLAVGAVSYDVAKRRGREPDSAAQT